LRQPVWPPAIGLRPLIAGMKPHAVGEAPRRPGIFKIVEIGRRGEMRMPNADIADRVFAQAAVIVERREKIRRDAALLERHIEERLVAWKIVFDAEGCAQI